MSTEKMTKIQKYEQMQLILFNLNPISKFNNFFLYQIPKLHLLRKMIILVSLEMFIRHGPLTPCCDQITFCIFPAVTVECWGDYKQGTLDVC